MPKQFLIGIFILQLIPVFSYTQVNGCYNSLTFFEFERFYTSEDQQYLKTLYLETKYPPHAREKLQEGIIRVQLINHSKDNTEIFVSGSIHQELLDVTRESIQQANAKHLINNDQKFITHFYFKYDLEPFDQEVRHNDDDGIDIIIKAFRIPR